MRTRLARYVFSNLLFSLLYLVYISMLDIYPMLPPLIGLLFVIFHRHFYSGRIFTLACVIVCLLYFELNKMLVFGILPVLFFFVHFVVKQFEFILNENIFFVLFYTLAVYFSYCFAIVVYMMGFDLAINISPFVLARYVLLDFLCSVAYNELVRMRII